MKLKLGLMISLVTRGRINESRYLRMDRVKLVRQPLKNFTWSILKYLYTNGALFDHVIWWII